MFQWRHGKVLPTADVHPIGPASCYCAESGCQWLAAPWPAAKHQQEQSSAKAAAWPKSVCLNLRSFQSFVCLFSYTQKLLRPVRNMIFTHIKHRLIQNNPNPSKSQVPSHIPQPLLWVSCNALTCHWADQPVEKLGGSNITCCTHCRPLVI